MFSSIDEQGRYAYANQPRIALWNLTRLAECLLPLFSDDQEQAVSEAQTALGGLGERLAAGDVTLDDVQPRLHEIVDRLYERVPAGVGGADVPAGARHGREQ